MADISFLKEILGEIEASPELTLFFKKLFEYPAYRLFFMHKDILFPLRDTIRFPVLFWSSCDDPSKTIERLPLISGLDLSEIKREHAFKFISSLFHWDVIKDLIVYGVIRFVRDNVEVKNLVNSDEFSFEKMKQTLGDYSRLNLKVFDELQIDETKTATIKDHLLKSTLNKLIEPFKKKIKDSGELLTSIADVFPDLLTNIHVGMYNHFSNLLHISGLQRPEYKNLLTELHNLGIISNLHTIFWCINCLDNSTILSTRSELNPHHLTMTCPRCGKPMEVSAVYNLDWVIRDSILSKNGLLGVAVAYLLKMNQLEYSVEAYNEYEYDFIVNENTLIECKMHRNDEVDRRHVREWFKQDSKQLSKHLEEAKKKGVTSAILVYNFEVSPYKAIADESIKMCREASITDYTQLPTIINTFKKKP